MCASITVPVDTLVESEEDFTVNLVLVTPVPARFSLGNTETTMILTDSEGKLLAMIQITLYLFSSYSCTV